MQAVLEQNEMREEDGKDNNLKDNNNILGDDIENQIESRNDKQ